MIPETITEGLTFDDVLLQPARSGVLSWNTHEPSGRIAFRLLRARRAASDWLDLAEWRPAGAKSFSPEHEGTRVDIDVIRAAQPFDGIEVRALGVEFELVAFSSPVRARASLPYKIKPRDSIQRVSPSRRTMRKSTLYSPRRC